MTAAELVRRLQDRGVVLSLKSEQIRFRGPKGSVTPEDRTLLAEHRDCVRDYLRRAAHYRASLIPALLARLADHGVYVALTTEGPELRQHAGADPENADQSVVDALNDRLDELVAFLKKSSADMSDAELAALGFRRGPNGVVMLAADAPEFGGGWSPLEEPGA